MQQLARDTGLTVHMAILEQNEAVLIDKVEPIGHHKLATWLGKRMDVHCTSLGKALIAFLPEAEVDRVIEERGLPRHNDNTIVSPRRLREELARVRAHLRRAPSLPLTQPIIDVGDFHIDLDAHAVTMVVSGPSAW